MRSGTTPFALLPSFSTPGETARWRSNIQILPTRRANHSGPGSGQATAAILQTSSTGPMVTIGRSGQARFSRSHCRSHSLTAARRDRCLMPWDGLCWPVTAFARCSPDHPSYHGDYGGDQLRRDGCYHQGPVWSWLLGPFAEATYRLTGDRNAALDLCDPSAITCVTLDLARLGDLRGRRAALRKAASPRPGVWLKYLEFGSCWKKQRCSPSPKSQKWSEVMGIP